MSEIQTVHVVFDGPPGPEAGRFIEVETLDGVGITVGTWVHRDDGYWVLELDVIPRVRTPSRSQAMSDREREPLEECDICRGESDELLEGECPDCVYEREAEEARGAGAGNGDLSGA